MNSIEDMECTLEDLENYLNGMPYYLCLKDEEGNIKYDNKLKKNTLNELSEEKLCNSKKTNISLIETIRSDYLCDLSKENVIVEEKEYDIDGNKYWYENTLIKILHETDTNKKLTSKWTALISREITLEKDMEDILKNNMFISINPKEYYDNNNGEKYDVIIRDIMYKIYKKIKPVSLLLYLYDYTKKDFYPNFIKGTYDNNVVNEFQTYIKELINQNNYIDDKELEKKYKEISKVRYDSKKIICHSITFAGKVVGILIVNFDEINNNSIEKYKNEHLLKSICNGIAFIINTRMLKKDLIEELKKRKYSELRLEQFIETATDLCATVKIEGNKIRYEKVTDSWKRVLGWDDYDINRICYIDLLHPKEARGIYDEVQRSKKMGQLNVIRNKILCKNNTYKVIEWRWKMFDKDTIVITGSDKTEEEKLEMEKKQLEDTINFKRLNENFFENMSYEFKIPLTVILSTIQLLQLYSNNDKKNDESENLLKYITGIKRNSYRLLKLVNDLIYMSKIDSGYYELNIENHNIVDVVENVTESVNEYFKDKIKSIIFDTNKEEIIFACDINKIEKVLLNILNTMIKYTDKNGNIRVDVNEDIGENKLEISINTDMNIISNENLTRILYLLNSKERLSLCMENVNTAVSLRISLVKSLLKFHKGDIYVENNSDRTFKTILRFPINRISSCKNDFIEEKSLNSLIERCYIEFSEIQ